MKLFPTQDELEKLKRSILEKHKSKFTHFTKLPSAFFNQFQSFEKLDFKVYFVILSYCRPIDLKFFAWPSISKIIEDCTGAEVSKPCRAGVLRALSHLEEKDIILRFKLLPDRQTSQNVYFIVDFFRDFKDEYLREVARITGWDLA